VGLVPGAFPLSYDSQKVDMGQKVERRDKEVNFLDLKWDSYYPIAL
jgi:hypothetical protein